MIAAGIEYAEQGQGPHPEEAVICLHGIGGGIESFRAQLDGLSGQRVIAWNMPGYGHSTPPMAGHSFAGLSDALAEFIVALGLRRAHIVGHSIGGMVALEHALRRPDQVASLVIIGSTPAFGGRDETFKTEFLKARTAPLEAGLTMEEMARDAAPALCGPDADPAVLAAVAAPMAAVSVATWQSILACLVTFNRRDDLDRVAAPACLIAGGFDRNAPPQTMEKFAARLPDARFHLIDNAGHMINQEAPDAVNSIIQDHLKRAQ